jgi:recombinational DNA repair protein (RecF pathway)
LVIIAFFVDSVVLFFWLHCLLLLGLGCSLASCASSFRRLLLLFFSCVDGGALAGGAVVVVAVPAAVTISCNNIRLVGSMSLIAKRSIMFWRV